MNKRGQNLTELAMVFAVVGIAFVAMMSYAKRGIQGKLKDVTNVIVGSTQRGDVANSSTGSSTTISTGTTTISLRPGGAGVKSASESTQTTFSSVSVGEP